MEQNSTSLNCGNLNLRPNDVVSEISSTQCANLGNSTGLDGNQINNCADLTAMVCAVKQCVDAIANQTPIVIAANDASKCQPDTSPTLASFWSRLLRCMQAMSCVVCQYDPFINTILKSGKYPQILMGAVQSDANGQGYPQWVSPDSTPTEGSSRPVTSSGVAQAVSEAILSVWHLWEEHPEFTYFAQTLNDESNTQNLEAQSNTLMPTNGDTALVGYDGTDQNVLYTYTDGAWMKTKVLTSGDGLTNFAVTHITKGYYADKGVYYFHDGTNDTWQVMDVELGDIESRIQALEAIYANAVVSADTDKKYIMTTVADAAAADNVSCTPGKETIVLITG